MLLHTLFIYVFTVIFKSILYTCTFSGQYYIVEVGISQNEYTRNVSAKVENIDIMSNKKSAIITIKGFLGKDEGRQSGELDESNNFI